MEKVENTYALVPKKELKCVWMTAGLLAYKLCKYDMQCERCPLDWELRNLSETPSLDSAAPQGRKNISAKEMGPPPSWGKGRLEEDFLTEDRSLLKTSGSLFYHPGHTWIKVEKVDEVRIGLDYFLGKIIGKVKVVVLPLSRKRYVQGEPLCSIIQEEGILHIVSPVSGSILSINQKLINQPDLVQEDPLGDGFLLTLKPKNLQQDEKYLIFGEAALSWCNKEVQRYEATIISELAGQDGVGMTMQDGGIKLRDVKQFITPERYIQLISTFLRNGEKEFHRSKHKKDFSSTFQLG